MYFSGYTPYPKMTNDTRLPHIAKKLHDQIHKTALGAEESVEWEYIDDLPPLITTLKPAYRIVALEQHSSSIPLPDYRPDQPVALLLGEEVNGIGPELLALCDDIVEIPMYGTKESFNVSVAAAMAIYQLHFRGDL